LDRETIRIDETVGIIVAGARTLLGSYCYYHTSHSDRKRYSRDRAAKTKDEMTRRASVLRDGEIGVQ
jgi:hypothetical protein